MISMLQARSAVLAGCAVVQPRSVALLDALGLVVAENVVASELIPPFANTAVDGIAVRAADTIGATADAPVALRVTATVAAGAAPSRSVQPGEAIRAMTGAPMPPGADAMVMVEDTVDLEEDRSVVGVLRSAEVGAHIRAAGDDVRPGDLVLGVGTVLTPAHLGILASIGRVEVLAYPRLKVGVISTGDELVEGPAPLGPGEIRDSNRLTLLALLAEAGFDGVDLGLIRDDEALITAGFERGATTCDAVISSGGVSMGEFDFVKQVLDRAGEINWMQVAIKPAKPLAFGHIGSTPIFGLPGNPVSSMVSFELFARPGLRKMAGHKLLDRLVVRAVLPDGYRRGTDGRTHYVRVAASYDATNRQFVARAAAGQGSHQLTGMAAANALAIVLDGPNVEPGGEVDMILLSQPPQ